MLASAGPPGIGCRLKGVAGRVLGREVDSLENEAEGIESIVEKVLSDSGLNHSINRGARHAVFIAGRQWPRGRRYRPLFACLSSSCRRPK